MRIAALKAVLGLAAVACLAIGCASQRGHMEASAESVPRFSLGWYAATSKDDTPSRIAAMGFDLVMPYIGGRGEARTDAFLDASASSGIGVVLEIPRALCADPEGTAFRDYVLRYAQRGEVRSWYLYDEPEWKSASRPKLLRAAYRRLKELDPGRPVVLVFMFPFLIDRYAGAMDELWFDNYPIAARSAEFSAFRGGRFARRMAAMGDRADRLGLPLKIVLQGFGEGADGKPQFWRRLPTRAETRYMIHAALLARPSGLLFWTLYRAKAEWIAESLLPELATLRERFPRGITYESAVGYSIDGASCDRIVLANDEGKAWLLVLNRTSRVRRVVASAIGSRLFASGSSRVEADLGAFDAAFIELDNR
jgi:hypothetical protein